MALEVAHTSRRGIRHLASGQMRGQRTLKFCLGFRRLARARLRIARAIHPEETACQRRGGGGTRRQAGDECRAPRGEAGRGVAWLEGARSASCPARTACGWWGLSCDVTASGTRQERESSRSERDARKEAETQSRLRDECLGDAQPRAPQRR